MSANLFRLFAACMALIPTLAYAAPGLIQYQGRLTDPSGNPIATPVTITFTFWSAATGGTQLGGGYYDTDGITPNSQGLYSTMIGDEPGTKIPDSIFTSPQVWLNIKIGSENLTPRKQLVAVAYAFQSNLATTATMAISAKSALAANVANLAGTALSAESALQANWAMQANWATTATTALSAKSAPEADTLATVTARGASTNKELTLGGGAKTGNISALTNSSSVLVEGVAMADGAIKLSPIVTPSDVSGQLYRAGMDLYWYGIPVMITRGSAYMYVPTSSDPAANGANLKAAYNRAKTFKPHNKDLATTNRLTILVLPGRYDLTATPLVLDTQFIDLVGVSTARADQYLFGNLSAQGTCMVLHLANDVHVENLFFEGACPTKFSAPAATYYLDSRTTSTVIRNCEFSGRNECWSFGIGSSFPGYYENCKAGDYSFGFGGSASGTFVNCTAGNNSFGSNSPANGTYVDCKAGRYAFGYYGNASGTFTRCTGLQYCYGAYSTASGTFTDCAGLANCFGFQSTASGKFVRCSAGDASYGYAGTASGTFTHCSATNGGFGANGVASGKFNNCTANHDSYGGTANGEFLNCTGMSHCFGYEGSAAGQFKNCYGYTWCFGSGSTSKAGSARGIFVDCEAGDYSFGSSPNGSATASTASGIFTHCVSTSYSFGAYNSNNASARLQGCRNEYAWSGTWAGTMENCRWGAGINCAATARIYGSTFVGTLNLNSTAAGVTQSRCKALANYGNNVFGATPAAAMIIADGDVQ